MTPFRNYQKVLKQSQIYAENPNYNEITCVREYQVYRTVNPTPISQLKQILEEANEENEIIKVLDGKTSLKQLLVDSYASIENEQEIYQVLPINSFYIDSFYRTQDRIRQIQEEIDQLEGPPAEKGAKAPPKSKEAQAEILNKQKEI